MRVGGRGNGQALGGEQDVRWSGAGWSGVEERTYHGIGGVTAWRFGEGRPGVEQRSTRQQHAADAVDRTDTAAMSRTVLNMLLLGLHV